MTVKEMCEKYEKLRKQGYETVTIGMVLGDLWHVKQERIMQRHGIKKEDR